MGMLSKLSGHSSPAPAAKPGMGALGGAALGGGAGLIAGGLIAHEWHEHEEKERREKEKREKEKHKHHSSGWGFGGGHSSSHGYGGSSMVIIEVSLDLTAYYFPCADLARLPSLSLENNFLYHTVSTLDSTLKHY
jgi:hypothetical protein